jgi:hypothetical protein
MTRSAAAITIARVGNGGFPLALAVVFLACQARGGLLVGLRVLATETRVRGRVARPLSEQP